MAPRNWLNKDRFVVLRKSGLVLEASAGGYGPVTKRWDMRIPLKNRQVRFNSGNAGTIADISAGSLLLVTTGDQAAGAAAATCNYAGAVHFTDA